MSEKLTRKYSEIVGTTFIGGEWQDHDLLSVVGALEAKLETIRAVASELLHQAEYLDVAYYDNVPVSFLRLAAQEEPADPGPEYVDQG